MRVAVVGHVEWVQFARVPRVPAAGAARVLVTTPRARDAFAGAGVEVDALVRSGSDPGETYELGDLDPPPRLVVTTLGGRGGRYEAADGRTGTWAAAAMPGPPVD